MTHFVFITLSGIECIVILASNVLEASTLKGNGKCVECLDNKNDSIILYDVFLN